MKNRVFFLLLTCWCISSSALPATIAPNLFAEMSSADRSALFPIVIRLSEHADISSLHYTFEGADKSQLRTAVCDHLQSFAQSSQSKVISYLQEAEREQKASEITPLWIVNAVSCYADSDTILALSCMQDVAYISWDYSPKSLLCEVTWGVHQIAADSLWQLPYYNVTGNGVVVAVVDTGCNPNHLDLSDHLWTNDDEIPANGIDDDHNGFVDDTWGWNFRDNNNSPIDDNGHGTHVAGIIASDGSAGCNCGVAPDTQIMTLKVSDSFDFYQTQTFLAFQYALNNGADVINLSSGVYQWLHPDRAAWRWACINTIAGGTLIVAAAGNEQDYGLLDSIRTPGDVPEVLTVGATANNDIITYFSSHGPVEWNLDPPFNDYPYPPGLIKPNVVAPGGRQDESNPWDEAFVIKSCAYNDSQGYLLNEGTSMATPMVAGLCALLLQVKPQLPPAQLVSAIESSALDLGDPGKDNLYGSGRIRAVRTLMEVIGEPNTNSKLPTALSLSCYPNPVTSSATILFSLPDFGVASLKLYDISGRFIKELASGLYGKGEHRLLFHADGLSSGVYFLRLEALDRQAFWRLVLLE
jgi:subtilisin family serine protease